MTFAPKWIISEKSGNSYKKYVIEDVGTMKYPASNFLKFKMADEKFVSSQIIESKKLLRETSSEG